MENIRIIQILHVFEVRSCDTKEMLDRHMFTGDWS